MPIRPARPDDAPAIWSILAPVIRAGETYTLDPEMGEGEALAYWMGPDKETFVAEEAGEVVGTYYMRANQAGGGRHVCNCGYMTRTGATGRGIARRMAEHSLGMPAPAATAACSSTSSSAPTSGRCGCGTHSASRRSGACLWRSGTRSTGMWMRW